MLARCVDVARAAWTTQTLEAGQVRHDIIKPTYQLVIKEAMLYYEGKLPAFDGNLGALLNSLELLERVRRAYVPS